MQVTEAQASKLICPFAQGYNYGQRKCAASACMAWDFTDPEHEYYQGSSIRLYRGHAYTKEAFWAEGSLPLGSEWVWEPASTLSATVPTTGWWRRPKTSRLGQCGRTMILNIEQG